MYKRQGGMEGGRERERQDTERESGGWKPCVQPFVDDLVVLAPQPHWKVDKLVKC